MAAIILAMTAVSKPVSWLDKLKNLFVSQLAPLPVPDLTLRLTRSAPDDELKTLLLHPESLGWNEALAKRFLYWRERDDAALQSSMRAFMTVCDAAGWGDDHPMLASVMVAMALASVPSHLPFHNHHHTREVVCLAVALALLQNHKSPIPDFHTRLAEIVIGACIHDFAHDGGGNRRHGKHTPMRLERHAADTAYAYLYASGLSVESWQRIKVMVLATDVSKSDGTATSPAEWMRRAYAGETLPADCPLELSPLFGDPILALQAALLEDADLATSAGMPYDYAKRMTALIATETKVLSPTPQTLVGFINHICHGTFLTPAAKAVFTDNMQKICDAANRESEDTIYNWS